MAEKVESLSDIDRLSGQSLSTLNEALKDLFLKEGGFQSMDDISAKIFPSVFSAIQNCLQKLLRKHPRYADIEFVLSGSTSEGVNIPNMSRKADGRVDCIFASQGFRSHSPLSSPLADWAGFCNYRGSPSSGFHRPSLQRWHHFWPMGAFNNFVFR